MNARGILEFILKKEGVTYYKLSKMMGLPRVQPLYNIRDGAVKSITKNYAQKIIEAFPDSGYTLAFLMTGDENLINTTKILVPEDDNVSDSNFGIELIKQSLRFSQDTVEKQRIAIAELEDEILRLKAENAALKKGMTVSTNESKGFVG